MDSSFVFEYIETLVKTQMTIIVAAIQVVEEQFGYQISYQKAIKAKRKAMLGYLVIGTSLMQSYPASSLLWNNQILDVLCIKK